MSILRIRVLSFQIIMLLFSASLSFGQYCSNDGRFTEVEFFSESQIDSTKNITYESAVDWQGTVQKLTLDAYYPNLSIDSLSQRPLVLLIHGGSYQFGDKSQLRNTCMEFAKRGFIAATISYRLGHNCSIDSISFEKATYRAQQDANAALRFVVENAALFRVDTSWIFIGGQSAGSATALGAIYSSQSDWNSFSPTLEGSLGGLNNVGNNSIHHFKVKGIFNNWGFVAATHISLNELTPMVSFHGGMDPLVDVDVFYTGGCDTFLLSYGSRGIHSKLLEGYVCSDLTVDLNGGHGVFNDAAGDKFRVGRASCFFKSLFCDDCSDFYTTDYIPANCSGTPLSAMEASKENNIVVYPIPFDNQLHFEGLKGNEHFTLFDLQGSILYQGIDLQNQNLEYLPKGIYFLKLLSFDGFSASKRLIK